MPSLYRIRDWEKLYENGETRKYRSLKWVPVPNKHDGAGFRRIMERKDACEIYAAWILMLQIASKSDIRGNLPESPEDCGYKTGLSGRTFRKAYEVLSSPEIGWIEFLGEKSQSPEISGEIPDSPETCGKTFAELNRTELDRTELYNTTPLSPQGEPDWRSSFEVYTQELQRQWKLLLEDAEWIQDRTRYHQGLDIMLSLEKAMNDFWGTENGWKWKKKGRSKNFDLKETLTKALSDRRNQVWKSKGEK